MRSKQMLALLVGAAVAGGGGFAASGAAFGGDSLWLSDVPTANTKSDGFAPASKLSPELIESVVAQGSTKLENPIGADLVLRGTTTTLLNAAGDPQLMPTPTKPTEAQKSEPDKNTYLVFRHGLTGADAQI